MRFILMFLVAASLWGQEDYQISPLEQKALEAVFNDSVLEGVRIKVYPASHFARASLIAMYRGSTGTIEINRSKIKKFRETFTIVHEMMHHYQVRIMGWKPAPTYNSDDYYLPYGRHAINFEQQAEAVRILAIRKLGIAYKPQIGNDEKVFDPKMTDEDLHYDSTVNVSR